MRDESERAAERVAEQAREEAERKDVILRTRAGDLDVLDLLKLYEKASADVLYGKSVLGECDVYGSGGLDGMVREAAQRLREKDAWIDELLSDASALENERRMWKSRAGTLRTLLDAALIELAVGFQKACEDSSETKDFARFIEPTFRETLAAIRKVSLRADALEADAWNKTVNLARDFVKDAKAGEDLGDGPGDPANDFIARWRDRFKAALG